MHIRIIQGYKLSITTNKYTSVIYHLGIHKRMYEQQQSKHLPLEGRYSVAIYLQVVDCFLSFFSSFSFFAHFRKTNVEDYCEASSSPYSHVSCLSTPVKIDQFRDRVFDTISAFLFFVFVSPRVYNLRYNNQLDYNQYENTYARVLQEVGARQRKCARYHSYTKRRRYSVTYTYVMGTCVIIEYTLHTSRYYEYECTIHT